MKSLFVYGSLRSEAGHPMHRRLAEGGTLLGRGSVRGRLLVVDWYPGLVDGDGRVVGELWQLGDEARFAELDAYEDDEFTRVQRDVTVRSAQTRRAWVYLYTGPVEGLDVVPSGDWLNRGSRRTGPR